MAEKKLTTLLEILNYSSELIRKRGLRDSRLNAEMMLADVLNCSRLNLYLNFDKPLTANEISGFKAHLKRRLTNEPLQYILGSTEFYGYNIMLSDGIFIPRPDTEMLVEKTLESIKSCQSKHVSILEIGTGSGCITTSLACELTKSGTGFEITSIDINQNALALARENVILNLSNIVSAAGIAQTYEPGTCIPTNVKFMNSNFLQDTLDLSDFDYIVSNPPYIPLEQIASLASEVRDFEPMDALTDNKDGLEFLKRLFHIAEADGNKTILFETAFDQHESVVKILTQNGINDYEYFKDYGGNWRVIKFII